AAIEDRLAELSRLKGEYGGSIETSLEHLAQAQDRLRQIETSDQREQELTAESESARQRYLESARKLHKQRVRAAKALEKTVEEGIAEVAMESARFAVQITENDFSPTGLDQVEFHFSANVGEDVKPLARVASGG